jgi:hypothetical protein
LTGDPPKLPSRRALAWTLFGLGFVLYARTIFFKFVDFDDTTILLGHPNLYGGPFLASLSQILVEYFPREEPLLVRDLTWLIDAQVFGFQNPLGYHLGNVLINAANGALLFSFLSRVLRSTVSALVISGLFVLAPLHAEAVSWVMGRKDVLSGLFMILALLTQEWGMSSEARGSRVAAAALVPLLTLTALLAKFSAVTFFLVLVLHRLFRGHLRGELQPGDPIPREAIKSAALHALPVAAVSVLVWYWYNANLSEWGLLGRGPPLRSVEHVSTLAQMIPAVMLRYLELLLLPTNYSISYERPGVDVPPSTVEVIGGAILSCALAGATVWSAKRRKDVFFFLASFAVLMIPYLNLVYIGIWVANRYLYLAIIGLLGAAVLFAENLSESGRRAALGVAGVTACVWAIGSIAHQGAFRDNLSLWQHETSVREPSLLAYQALARAYVKLAETTRAPAERESLLARADEAIELGVAHYRELPVKESAYYTNSLDQFAKLAYHRGRVAALRGAPLTEQLRLFEEAYKIRVSRLNAMTLAETHFKIAVRASQPEEREEHARASLRYFLQQAEHSQSDPLERAQNAAALEQNYARTFPFLAAEVEDARRRYFR